MDTVQHPDAALRMYREAPHVEIDQRERLRIPAIPAILQDQAAAQGQVEHPIAAHGQVADGFPRARGIDGHLGGHRAGGQHRAGVRIPAGPRAKAIQGLRCELEQFVGFRPGGGIRARVARTGQAQPPRCRQRLHAARRIGHELRALH